MKPTFMLYFLLLSACYLLITFLNSYFIKELVNHTSSVAYVSRGWIWNQNRGKCMYLWMQGRLAVFKQKIALIITSESLIKRSITVTAKCRGKKNRSISKWQVYELAFRCSVFYTCSCPSCSTSFSIQAANGAMLTSPFSLHTPSEFHKLRE